MLNGRIEKFKNGFQSKVIKEIAIEAAKSESCTVLAMPGAGKGDIISYLTSDDFLLRYCANPNTLIIDIDLNNLLEVNPLNFYRYLYKSLVQRSLQFLKDREKDHEWLEAIESEYRTNIVLQDAFLIFESIKDLVSQFTDHEYNLIIISDHLPRIKSIGSTIFNNLKVLRNINKEKIALLFIANINLYEIITPEEMGNLYALINFKKIFIPLLTEDDTNFVIQEFEKLYTVDIPNKVRKQIYTLSGGNIWYIKSLTKIYSESGISSFEKELDEDIVEFINQEQEMKSVNENTWNKFSESDQNKLLSFVKSKTTPLNEFLKNTGVVQIKENVPTVFSPLFNSFLINLANETETTKNDSLTDQQTYINKETRQVYLNGVELNIEFTRTEFNVISLFINHLNEVVSRDDVAKAMWGEDFYDSYSDYAIDRNISRIRKKLKDNASAPKYLHTIKGVGFKFST
ncbi:response regulator transcription factor [Candidatus Dojkabacteria bacterium]|uniref:Response regulator transcription factor n=1 Tax=Candidatus Dojkabacteria bacterium TaxID=2099670 RepID=A0A955RHR6_9BACT|nr:response regulator transcription factor [Candidatus Dojkabacteria bacterium]